MVISKNNLANKKITILGMKKSGYSAALLASKFGSAVLISDSNKDEIINHNYKKLKEAGIQCEIGGHTNEIYSSDLWIISPGIPKDANVIKKATKLKIPIISEIEFAGNLSKSKNICITGTNGKTSVVSFFIIIGL